jgi:hypothetical protein
MAVSLTLQADATATAGSGIAGRCKQTVRPRKAWQVEALKSLGTGQRETAILRGCGAVQALSFFVRHGSHTMHGPAPKNLFFRQARTCDPAPSAGRPSERVRNACGSPRERREGEGHNDATLRRVDAARTDSAAICK